MCALCNFLHLSKLPPLLRGRCAQRRAASGRMEVDAFVHMEVTLYRPATCSIFRNRHAACAHMEGCNEGRVQTFRLTGHQARIYSMCACASDPCGMIYMMQGTKCILGSMSGPFVVCRYVRGEEEVTSSSKTLLRLKFNPGVSVLRGKISPFTASTAATRSQTGDFCGWENANVRTQASLWEELDFYTQVTTSSACTGASGPATGSNSEQATVEGFGRPTTPFSLAQPGSIMKQTAASNENNQIAFCLRRLSSSP